MEWLDDRKAETVPNDVQDYERQNKFIEKVGEIIDVALALGNKFIEDYQYGRQISLNKQYNDTCNFVQLLNKFKRDYPYGTP